MLFVGIAMQNGSDVGGEVRWLWKRFKELSVDELYEVVRLRERVFVVEQKCVYLDADQLDKVAWHLMGFFRGELVAYLRVLPAGSRFSEVSFGRVVTAPEARKLGYGKLLTKEAMTRIEATFGVVPVRISAQAYLDKFYSSFGFKSEGMVYLEDGIPHLEMVRS